MRCITLTTDFGPADWFVGVMKGVIAGLAPEARVIDLTHGVPAGDVAAGAYALAAGCRHFPKGTIHVAVIDPGVGGPRHAVAAKTADYLFLGPDNGVLSLALARERVRQVRRIENTTWFRRPVSPTFHGRDVFAPVAARLARGGNFTRVGPPTDHWVRLPWPEPARQGPVVRGEVVYVDRFGNLITNIPQKMLGRVPASWRVFLPHRAPVPVAESYQAVPPGRPVALVGSSGFLEIAVNGGAAARKLGLRRGAAVALRRSARLQHTVLIRS
jgi:S-adenosylmethionine hydrolase